jgi:hypothetical protein
LIDSWLAVLQARDHPDVLDGAALQHPPGVYLASTPMRRSIVEDGRHVEGPSANEPRVKLKLGRTVRVRTGGVEHLSEGRMD